MSWVRLTARCTTSSMLWGRDPLPKSRKTGPDMGSDLRKRDGRPRALTRCANRLCKGSVHTMAAPGAPNPSPDHGGAHSGAFTPESLRVLAHPLRSRLLGALRR